MPIDVTEEYIRIRQKDPDLFVDGSFRTIDISKDERIKAVIGKLKSDPDGSTVVQSYLFDKDKWTVDEAKKWIKDHKEKKSIDLEGFQPSLFEIKKEVRSFLFQVGAAGKEERKMSGHAAVFGEIAEIGGWFQEMIEPGAFKSSIKKDDIRALFNHNPDYVLGRNKAGTLVLSEDEKGLMVSIDPPDTQFARDLRVSIERGDINQMSFSFDVIEEEWIRGEKKKPDLRKIKKVALWDVSPVTYPAYEGTDIAIRSHELWKNSQKRFEIHPTILNLSVYRQLLLRRM